VTEKRVVLQNCGVIDPKDITTYIDRDGFKALRKALKLPPEQLIGEIKASGLRGRGGAGFPCGLKWDLARKAQGDEKYVICNADEGEVGTFKDRYILENDPFSLIEGIAIAGYAIGARKAYIYLRAEYHFLLGLLEEAIGQSKKRGFLKYLDIEIRQGAGAYVCGEESALMDSIEGKRGEVRYRPPFPPTSGLWSKPTIINNVETLMNVPRIVLNGAEWFKKMGTEKSKGTKVFSVSGDVKNPGVYELVLGSSLKELVEDLAGAKKVQAVQVGGATGRIIPADKLDTPLSFETILGAGAITVFNKSRDMIDIVYRTLEFLAEESCGKCAPCREGTEAMVEILHRFSKGEGREKDITILGELADTMMLASMCGLGQAAPIPVVDSLQHFRDAYDQRIQS
jgi:NADH:ubiquinone oxidoreductase subunit F (NADH-binding)